MQLLKCVAGFLRNVIFVVNHTTSIVIQHPMKVVNGLVQNVGQDGIKRPPFEQGEAMTKMQNEQLAYILEYLYKEGFDKKLVKKAVDIWWSIKEEKV
jgi:hypothetical protein